MSRAAVGLVIALGGCNALFGLDPTTRADRDAPMIDAAVPVSDARPIDATVDATVDASGCFPIGHDDDQDGVDDACDNCPGVRNTGQLDVDGDQVGDACDPSLAPDDDIIAFDSFAVPTSWSAVSPGWSRGDDTFDQFDLSAGPSLARRALPDPSAPELTVDVAFSITGVLPVQNGETAALRGLGVWFVASGGSVGTNPTGYLCEVTTDLAQPASFLATGLTEWQPTSATGLASGMLVAPLDAGTTGRIRVARSATNDARTCHFWVGTSDAPLVGRSQAITSGSLGLRTLYTAVAIQSVTIYGKKP